MEVCQRTSPRFSTGLLRRGGWLLLLALGTVVSSAGMASAYDLAAGRYHTCAIDDDGLICWGNN